MNQMKLFFYMIFVLTKELQPISRSTATISFDEGPSKNISSILSILEQHNLKVTFHIDPSKIKNKDQVLSIIRKGHVIGLAVTEDLTEMSDDEVKAHISDLKQIFVDKTGYVPKFVRLPRMGYTDEHVKIAEDLGLSVTRPNLDSEDIDLSDFVVPFEEYVGKCDPNETSLSVVLRDRMRYTVRNLDRVINILKQKGYKIVSLGDFHNCSDEMINSRSSKNKEVSKLEDQSENTNKNLEEKSTESENKSKHDDKNKLAEMLNDKMEIKAKDKGKLKVEDDEDIDDEDIDDLKEGSRKDIDKKKKNIDKDEKKTDKDKKKSWANGPSFSYIFLAIPLLLI